MRSYIKIYGPPVLKAIEELEKLAVNMPQVCIMDTVLAVEPMLFDSAYIYNYLGTLTGGEVPKERCNNIISRSEEVLGEYDFVFEWFKEPSGDECRKLIEKIDEALAPLGCKYTITTK